MRQREIPEIDGVSFAFESVLGQGGTAEVWRVRSVADGRSYALKRIAKDGESRRRNERFRSEIAFGMVAKHEHVIQIHAQHEDDTHFFYTMDLYAKSFRDVISEEFDYGILLHYLSQLCDGLAYVHAQGIHHRDIKPENILIDPEQRRLVLADFGIAHFKDSTLTRRGELLANRNYQAPEQMAKKEAARIGKPADIFALGLIITEAFTKQNARGVRHKRIGDVHPFLADLDLVVERMTLQDDTQRTGIEAVKDMLHLATRRVEAAMITTKTNLAEAEIPVDFGGDQAERVLARASEDILSAKYIFERIPDEDLGRYDVKYHAEIAYSASPELLSACVHSTLYTMCKEKFEREGLGMPDDVNGRVLSPESTNLQRELEAIQSQFPLKANSIWDELPRITAHYFRFCTEYHREELLRDIRRSVDGTRDDSLLYNLIDAPIIWLTRHARGYLKSDFFETSQRNLELIGFEQQVAIQWEGTCPDDSAREARGTDLLAAAPVDDSIDSTLETLVRIWNVSVAERSDGRFSIHFRSRADYLRFQATALAKAAAHHVFEGDVLDLLRPDADFDDLVAFIWEPNYEIRSVLAKILGLRDIR